MLAAGDKRSLFAVSGEIQSLSLAGRNLLSVNSLSWKAFVRTLPRVFKLDRGLWFPPWQKLFLDKGDAVWLRVLNDMQYACSAKALTLIFPGHCHKEWVGDPICCSRHIMSTVYPWCALRGPMFRKVSISYHERQTNRIEWPREWKRKGTASGWQEEVRTFPHLLYWLRGPTLWNPLEPWSLFLDSKVRLARRVFALCLQPFVPWPDRQSGLVVEDFNIPGVFIHASDNHTG